MWAHDKHPIARSSWRLCHVRQSLYSNVTRGKHQLEDALGIKDRQPEFSPSFVVLHNKSRNYCLQDILFAVARQPGDPGQLGPCQTYAPTYSEHTFIMPPQAMTRTIMDWVTLVNGHQSDAACEV